MWQLDVHVWSWKHATSTKCGFHLKLLLVVLSNFNFVLGAKQNYEVYYLDTS